MRRIFSAVLFCGAVVAAAPAQAAEPCVPKLMAALDMGTTPAGGITVVVGMNGEDLTMLLQAGELTGLLKEDAARRAGLNTISFGNGQSMIIGGPSLEIGDWNADTLFLRITTDPWVQARLPQGVDGAIGLGAFRMSNMDLELDFAHNKANVYKHCDGAPVWPGEIPVAVSLKGGVTLPNSHVLDLADLRFTVRLDGKDFEAAMTTGIGCSELSLETAHDVLGVDGRGRGLAPADDGAAKGLLRYPFQTLALSDVTLAAPQVLLRSDKDAGRAFEAPRLTLGTALLRRLHIYIAYTSGIMYVAPIRAP